MAKKDLLALKDGDFGLSKDMTGSQVGAKLAAIGLVSSQTAALYSPQVNSERVGFEDMVAEASKAASNVAEHKLGRVETMLVSQMIALDAMFNNLAQRAYKSEYIDGMATYTKLALRCQAQARCAAEALAMIKNPQPYIKQANIAQGNQQVNNTYASTSVCNDAPMSNPEMSAKEFEITPNKLLGENHERMDTRAPSKASRDDQVVAAVDSQHRRKNARR